MEALGFRVAVMGIMVQLSFSNAQTLAVMLNGDFDLPRWLDSAFPQAYQRECRADCDFFCSLLLRREYFCSPNLVAWALPSSAEGFLMDGSNG